MYETLLNSELFNFVEKKDLIELFKHTPTRIICFDEDELIAYSNDQLKGIYFVIEGSVRGEMINSSMKTIKIEDISVPRMIAPAFIFGKKNRLPVNIVGNSSGKLLFISKQNFVEMMQANEKILMNFLDIVSNRTQFLSNKINFLTFKSIKQKLAHYLVQQMKMQDSNDITLPQSQEKIADFFGVTRPALAKVLQEFNEDGIILSKGKKVKIIDVSKLQTMLH